MILQYDMVHQDVSIQRITERYVVSRKSLDWLMTAVVLFYQSKYEGGVIFLRVWKYLDMVVARVSTLKKKKCYFCKP